jgi:hypothetical protein
MYIDEGLQNPPVFPNQHVQPTKNVKSYSIFICYLSRIMYLFDSEQKSKAIRPPDEPKPYSGASNEWYSIIMSCSRNLLFLFFAERHASSEEWDRAKGEEERQITPRQRVLR